MSTRVDALRNTLDHLALDPKASEDRRYLVSMLRRLGYSDAEIEAELGPIGGEPGRVIEVEYEPAQTRGAAPSRSRETTFQVGGPEEGLSFRIADDDAPAGAGVEEVHATDISGVESDLGDWGDDYQQGPRDDFTSVDGGAPDDFSGGSGDDAGNDTFSFQGEEDLVEFRAVARPDPAVAAGWREDGGDAATGAGWTEADTWGGDDAAAPVGDAGWGEEPEADLSWAPPAEPEAEPWPETAGAGEAAGETAWPEPEPEPEAAEEWSDAAGQVARTEADPGQALVPWPEADEPEADAGWPQEPAADAWEDAGAPQAGAWEDAAWEDVDGDATAAPAAALQNATPEAAAPYTHGDYTLYTREVHLSTGREQRIYFFAKSTPQSGQPCPLPDGYEVIENDKTGLPFLRRQR